MNGPDTWRRWALSLPAVAVIMLFSILPLGVVLVYSFLTPGDFGNVKWIFSTDGWFSVLFERNIFDDTIGLFGGQPFHPFRSIILSVLTTLITLIFGCRPPGSIATRPPTQRNFWLFLITIPFWTTLLVRTIAVQEMIRSEGVFNRILLALGLIKEPIQMMYTDFAVLLGMTYVFCRSWCCRSMPPLRSSISASRRGELRSLTASAPLPASGYPAADQARRHRRLDPRLRASLGAYVTPRAMAAASP